MSIQQQQESKKIAVRFSNVVFGYDSNHIEPTVKNINFEIYDGEYICVVGHNGSGKSTISKILVGLLKPWSGEVTVFNTVLSRMTLKAIRNKVGIVFQNPDNQFIGITAEDDIAFGLENHKINSTYMHDIIQTASSIVNVQNLLKFNASKLSGGQKQRIAIASTLAMNPDIIIFDESTSMLDPKAKIELKNLILLLKNKYHKTIISITHDMEELTLCDRALVIKQGEVLKIGKPNYIFEDPQFLKENKLALPFDLELSKLLNEKNDKIDITIDENKLIEKINSLC